MRRTATTKKRARRAAPTEKLSTYRARRDFSKTPEPSGQRAVRGGNSYLIQKHDATRLHYDFRLELDGVLLSWAVPKGPSLKAGEKRLAARTEDHPLDYGTFEGIIPEGQYGGSTVMMWDHGTWEPEGDAAASLKKGKLTFELRGEKLKGRWHLVRTGQPGTKEQWLLFKGRDAEATGEDILAKDKSVTTGRSLDEIAEQKKRVWNSNRADGAAEPGLIELVKQIPTKVKLTHLDKVIYPELGLTKAALIAYWASMSERILPFIAERPLALLRCPAGRSQCFFQKHATSQVPEQVGRVELEEKDGTLVTHLKVVDAQSLIALAQMGVLELHTWGCHADDVEHPDELVMDLDPDEGLPWAHTTRAALELRDRLHAMKLESLVKTTGGKGLHVVVPFKRGIAWDAFKAFAKQLAEAMEKDAPDRFTSNMSKAQRKGKIFVDYLRNGRGATAIAAYSVRAREGAPVACPVAWDALEGLDPKSLTVLTVPSRQDTPWADYRSIAKQKLPAQRR